MILYEFENNQYLQLTSKQNKTKQNKTKQNKKVKERICLCISEHKLCTVPGKKERR